VLSSELEAIADAMAASCMRTLARICAPKAASRLARVGSKLPTSVKAASRAVIAQADHVGEHRRSSGGPLVDARSIKRA